MCHFTGGYVLKYFLASNFLESLLVDKQSQKIVDTALAFAQIEQTKYIELINELYRCW